MPLSRDPEIHDRRTVEIVYTLAVSAATVAAVYGIAVMVGRGLGWADHESWQRSCDVGLAALCCIGGLWGARSLYRFEQRTRQKSGE